MVKTHAGLSTGPNENMVVSEELKSYLDEQFGTLADKDDMYAMKEDVMSLITNMVKEQGDKISALETKIDVLEAKNAMLESHVAQLQSNQESQEQYSRKLCLRIPAKGNQESSDDVLEKVKNVLTEIGVEVPDAVIDRAHRIGPKSFADGKAKQQVIVRLTTWRHRTAIYRAREKSNKVKICLDLTKPRLNLIIAANELLKEHKDSFAFADVNCRPRVKFNGKFSFFDTVDDIMVLVSAEDNNHEST